MEPTILLAAAAALGGLAVGALLGACLTMARFGFDPFDGTIDDESPNPREPSANPPDIDLAKLEQSAPRPPWLDRGPGIERYGLTHRPTGSTQFFVPAGCNLPKASPGELIEPCHSCASGRCIAVAAPPIPWGGGCSSGIRGQCQAIQRSTMRSGQWIPVDRQP